MPESVTFSQLRSEILERLANKHALADVDANKALRLIAESLRRTLEEGRRAEFRGFGSFAVKRYDAGFARNPSTGEQIELPVRYRAFFKAGEQLRERVQDPRQSA